ncbi:lipopolysaccharide biosynthesis protein [Microbacterium sp. ARD31]|uniref:lipopolysaccharide biosynthesis protein n=1 Tax=Microbacterium sp. ARD31 TaxID=2962576 RepID=UPI002880D2D7|nr:lipopolysaccharide biosynthesis protein [Microbacterium sp. ARD31]MDT0183421.1 lipopolysaccharide biosynthesis protein [Microbacterium sp. ARD31]
MSTTLGQKAVRGVLTTGSGQVARLLLQIVSVVVLARLISPDDYGLVAMVTAVVGIGEILREMGLSSATIQAKELSRAQRDNLFWISGGAGLAVSLLVSLAAPVLVVLYQRSEVLGICLALAPTFLLSGLTAQYRAGLTREMRFKALALSDVACSAAALTIGVLAAAAGLGYWALVLQQVSSGVFTLVTLVVVSGWLPGRYDRSAPMAKLVRFGASVLGSQVLTYVSVNADSVLIGSAYGARDLGYYNRGLQLVRTPLNQLRAPIGTVALPVLSRLQDDPRRFMEFVSSAQLAVAYPLLAGIGWFIACGEAAVRVALGPTWVDATPVIQLIAAGEGLSTLMFLASWMYLSLGMGAALIRFSAFTLVLRLVLLLVALPFGLVAVAAVGVVGPVIVLPLALWQVGRSTGLPTHVLLRQAAAVLSVASAVSMITALTVRAMESLPDPIVILTAACVQAVGLTLAQVVPSVRRQTKQVRRALTLLRSPATDAPRK